ncbi:MAG: hypothetical protein GY856_06870 [bacterium]|nr:hypothetical protein [bacterium]
MKLICFMAATLAAATLVTTGCYPVYKTLQKLAGDSNGNVAVDGLVFAAQAPSAIELPAQILDSKTIEAYVGCAHEPASSRLNLREILFLESCMRCAATWPKSWIARFSPPMSGCFEAPPRISRLSASFCLRPTELNQRFPRTELFPSSAEA